MKKLWFTKVHALTSRFTLLKTQLTFFTRLHSRTQIHISFIISIKQIFQHHSLDSALLLQKNLPIFAWSISQQDARDSRQRYKEGPANSGFYSIFNQLNKSFTGPSSWSLQVEVCKLKFASWSSNWKFKLKVQVPALTPVYSKVAKCTVVKADWLLFVASVYASTTIQCID